MIFRANLPFCLGQGPWLREAPSKSLTGSRGETGGWREGGGGGGGGSNRGCCLQRPRVAVREIRTPAEQAVWFHVLGSASAPREQSGPATGKQKELGTAGGQLATDVHPSRTRALAGVQGLPSGVVVSLGSQLLDTWFCKRDAPFLQGGRPCDQLAGGRW